MQFLVIAYDGTDDKAPERRMAAREKILEGQRDLLDELRRFIG